MVTKTYREKKIKTQRYEISSVQPVGLELSLLDEEKSVFTLFRAHFKIHWFISQSVLSLSPCVKV